MDWHILLFSLYVACLVGILILLVLVARKHSTPKRTTNFAEAPAWQFRTQEALSLLAWVSALAFGVLSLCSDLGVIESEGFTPNTVLFLATLFGHLIILWDMVLAFGIRQPVWYWGTAGVMILIMDSTSVVVTAAEAGTKRKTLVSQILPPILATLVDGGIATSTAMALRNTGGLSSNTRPYLSISAMLRHLHIVPLWIWPFLNGVVWTLTCQYLQMLILVYPWCYSPVTLFWRWRRRGVAAKGQIDKQSGSRTGGSESTWELVSCNSQNPAPIMPALMDAKAELVRITKYKSPRMGPRC